MKIVSIILMLFTITAVAEEPSPAKLPDGTAKVALILYDYSTDLERPQIETEGKMHSGVIPGYTKYLNQPQIDKLLKALTQNHAQRSRLMCDFAPHHGIVFEAQDGRILGSVSICFGCKEIQSRTFPEIESVFYSYWGWSELKEIVKEAGFPIAESDEYFSTLRKSKNEQGGAHKPLNPDD